MKFGKTYYKVNFDYQELNAIHWKERGKFKKDIETKIKDDRVLNMLYKGRYKTEAKANQAAATLTKKLNFLFTANESADLYL